MLRAYTRVINEGLEWPVIGQGDSLKPGGSDAARAEDPRTADLHRRL